MKHAARQGSKEPPKKKKTPTNSTPVFSLTFTEPVLLPHVATAPSWGAI